LLQAANEKNKVLLGYMAMGKTGRQMMRFARPCIKYNTWMVLWFSKHG
jgi:hypothetical protein